MNILINLFIFCLVLFFYIHIIFNYKKSNDLEVYEIEEPSKEKLEEICDIKQPILFNIYNENLENTFNYEYLLNNYNSFDLKIRTNDSNYKEKESLLYLPYSVEKSTELFKNDLSGIFLSEKNKDFIEETSLSKIFKYNDQFLRPFLQCFSEYDLILGSIDSYTPLKYEIFNRNYLYINKGSIKITLIPPIMSKYLHVEKDYENLEFRSLINPWNVDIKYKGDYDKIKPLELTLIKNQNLYIPPYWFFSIKFQEEETVVLNFKYQTYMSMLSITNELFLKYLQNNNIKHNLFKSVSL